MDKKLLESYQANMRLIRRNTEKIEDEKLKDIPVISGKVRGSSKDFPYTEQRFTVKMYEPAEADRSNRRILNLEQEIAQAEKSIKEVEQFVAGIEDMRDREIFTYRYMDNMKVGEIAKKLGYTKGRISQIISKYVKD